MNSNRSYIENLNAGRQRRSDTSLEDISRTLDQIESRLERALNARRNVSREDADITSRIERLSQAAARHAPGPAAPAQDAGEERPQAALPSRERVARHLENSRRLGEDSAPTDGVAEEFEALRREMRTTMGTSLRREFDALRDELAEIMAAVPRSPISAELNVEFERLSRAIEHLADRSDDKSTKMLRLELEQVRSSLAKLAREETVRSLDQRWSEIERQLAANGSLSPDPAIEGLSRRLDEIAAAVGRLPDTLSLHSLEERLLRLAESFDQFAAQRNQQPDLYEMIEERLDEISRAITASAARAHTANFDPKLLERIEARISSLAGQLDEIAGDIPGEAIVEKLTALSERVDALARRLDAPEQAVERLSGQIDQISEKLDTMPARQDTDELFRKLEDRFAHLSGSMEQRQEDVIRQGHGFFQDVERRLQEMAERFEQPRSAESDAGIMAAMDRRFAELAARLEEARAETGDSAAFRALEARLEDIARRLQDWASESAQGIDAEVIRSLETQVASLASHLERPAPDYPEIGELAPRLDNIERSITEHHAAIVDAARQAAEQAIRALTSERGEPLDDGLQEEIRNLEALTRKSDERNSKTFEAIHDTLLKIVERLSTIEEGKIAVTNAPSIDPADGYEDPEHGDRNHPDRRRTPAEAAAAAAEAALSGDNGRSHQDREQGSMLSGFSRALKGRGGRAPEQENNELAVAGEVGTEEADEPTLDVGRINEPLEPGSGAPDLNAIMRRVRQDREAQEPESADTAKADFIAAARRAAQAAAAEAEILKSSRADTAKKGGKFSVGKILGRRKKQLLLGIGFAVVIAAGLYNGRAMLTGGGSPELVAQAPGAGEEQVSGAADEPEKLASVTPEQSEEVLEQAEPATSLAGEPDMADQEIATAAVAEDTADEAAATPLGAQDTAQDDADAARAVAAEPGSQQDAPQEDVAGDAAAETSSTGIELAAIPTDAGPAALRQAAAEQNPVALYEIGNRYAEGIGMEADMAEAARWFEAAAELGLAPAQYRIGNLYEKGLGVERDVEAAKIWYRRAAEQGNVSAMHNLGVLYAMGADGTPDNETAALWFIEAAERGVADSQFNLGILAAKGAGVKRDLVEAYKWFDIVARTGDADAAEKRDQIAKVMAPADLAKAQGKAKLWKAREADPEANIVDVPEEWRTDKTPTGSIDMKRAIGNIQVILNKNGFDAGPADGVMGERTRAAIRAFQKESGLPVTGEIDEALVQALLERDKQAQ